MTDLHEGASSEHMGKLECSVSLPFFFLEMLTQARESSACTQKIRVKSHTDSDKNI
jgi:hypothetical protein